MWHRGLARPGFGLDMSAASLQAHCPCCLSPPLPPTAPQKMPSRDDSKGVGNSNNWQAEYAQEKYWLEAAGNRKTKEGKPNTLDLLASTMNKHLLQADLKIKRLEQQLRVLKEQGSKAATAGPSGSTAEAGAGSKRKRVEGDGEDVEDAAGEGGRVCEHVCGHGRGLNNMD